MAYEATSVGELTMSQLGCDGLQQPVITIRAHQLLSTVCAKSGLTCPLMASDHARSVLAKVESDPTVTIRLTSDADESPHRRPVLPDADDPHARLAVFNRKRDLDVLQRLGLAPGDVRRARYLYTLLFQRVETPDGICAHSTPGWSGCDQAKSGGYERVREAGWSALVYHRPEADRAAAREAGIERARTADRLFIRPHHLMCMSCWLGGGDGEGTRGNDTLDEIYRRIKGEPDVPITLVEGCCMACECCDGYHPETTRCVHDCGLIRDYHKDLELFCRLGLFPGATLPANELLQLIYERVPATTGICGFGDGQATSREWFVCGGPEGNQGYLAARRRWLDPES